MDSAMTITDTASAPTFTDVLYATDGPVAVVTINRPERMNAMTAHTVDELIAAFNHAWADPAVAAVILTGAGDRAFCTGGDTKQRAETGDYGPSATGIFQIDNLHRVIRDIPKPVIAAVNAQFGQVGPRVGSFDAGFGSTYLARVVGEKRAREIWYLCRRYEAVTAERWGLVNAVVPADRLLDEAKAWAAEIAEKSPTAIEFLKRSFNVDTEHQAGLANMASSALAMYLKTAEGQEGARAFAEKRTPDFRAGR